MIIISVSIIHILKSEFTVKDTPQINTKSVGHTYSWVMFTSLPSNGWWASTDKLLVPILSNLFCTCSAIFTSIRSTSVLYLSEKN